VEPLEPRLVLAAPHPFDLASLLPRNGGNGSTGVILFGVDTLGLTGRAVSDAGDVNGDGFDDLLIGAPQGNAAGNSKFFAGESYVVFGKADWSATPTLDLVTLNGTNGFMLFGVDVNDESGCELSGVGDVNGDGFDDLLIGAHLGAAAENSKPSAGESYVVFGKANWSSTLDLATLNGSNGFTLFGVDGGDKSGGAVSGAGDVNGDGFDDLLIGAYFASPTGYAQGAGESYVVFGKPNWSATPTLDLATLNGTNGFTLFGGDTGDFSGRAVSGAGDVNGDGFDDLLIGALFGDAAGNAKLNAGESYVVFGKADWLATPTLDLATLNGTNGFTVFGVDVYELSGLTVSGAGDVNWDGFDDLLIGAGGYFGDPGKSYMVFGKADWSATATLDLATLNGTNGFTLFGVDGQDGSGRALSGAGDVNQDGFDDLLIGAYGGDAAGNAKPFAGESYVVFGKADWSTTPTLDLATLNGTNGFTLFGVDTDDRSGDAVSGAGDVNGDGFDDLLIGAPGGAAGHTKSQTGESYVVFGGNFTNSATPTVTLGVAPASLAEAVGTSTVTATLSAASILDVTVNLGFSGTATNVSDYTRSATQIVITAGNTTGTVTLTAVPDTLDETDETIVVDITGVTNGRELGTQRVTATISDVNPSVEEVAAVLQRQTVTGATIVTHGYQFSDSDGDALAPLAQAIRTRADTENGPIEAAWFLDYDLVESNGQFAGVFDAAQSVLPNPGIPARGEVVLLFDWARESNESSSGWGEAAGDALFNLLVGLGLVSPAAGTSVPLHLIGHSFGTVVTSEAVERLATFSIPVDQVTYLDPHDFDQGILPVDGSQRLYELGKPDGYGATVWQNVAFTDVYYQTEFAPDGRPIPGAYNVLVNDQVSGIDAHSDVWNIVYKATVSDSNSTTGYAFSRIAQQATGSHPNLRDASNSQFRFYSAQQDHQHSSETLVDSDTGNANTQGLNQLGLTVDAVNFAAWPPATNPLEIVNGDFRHIGDELLPGWVDHGGGRVSICPAIPICADALDGSLTLGIGTSSRTHNWFYVPAFATRLLFDLKRTDASSDDQLVVRIGTQIVRTLPLNSVDGSFMTQSVEIPTALRDGSRTLEFAITAGGAGIDSEVRIDNVRLAANTRMYRAYNPNADSHFFTTSRAQFDNAVRNGYRDESTGNSGFDVFETALTDVRGTAIPIYRVYNLQRGTHYYTLNLNEKNFLVNIVPPPASGPDTRTIGWRDEGIEGYMYAAPVGSAAPSGTTLVHRLYNNNSGVHFFTQDVNTRNAILAAFPGVWVEHDPVGYAFAVNASGQAAARRALALAESEPYLNGDFSAVSSVAQTSAVGDASLHSTSDLAGQLAMSRSGNASTVRTRGSADANSETSELLRHFETARDRVSRDLDQGLLDQVWSDIGDELGLFGER
jgi:hypothetical protein